MPNVYWGIQGALSDGANPTILVVGDSWFWYPLDNLAVELAAKLTQQTFLVVGYNGAEALDWATKYRKDIDFTFKEYGAGAQGLILSGGGNEIAGFRDFLRLIKDDCSAATTVADCYRAGQPLSILGRIAAAYLEVVLRFRAVNPNAPVFMHNYDNAWPTGKGVFGPSDWLKKPMDAAKVPSQLRRDLFKDLLSQLHDAQLKLSSDPNLGKLSAIKTTGTMPDDSAVKNEWWANELHPTPKGFKRIARKTILPELKKYGIR